MWPNHSIYGQVYTPWVYRLGSPLLFIIYINDLTEYLNECRVNLYADDTALYSSAPSHIDLLLTLRTEISVVAKWLKANKLTLNVAKTRLVVFGSRVKLQNTPKLNLSINNKPIEQVTGFKYLGLFLDDKLTFNSHVDYIHSKAVKKLGIIRKARNFLDRSPSIILYKSLVLPHLDYCDIVYCNMSNANLQKLQVLQNGACRTLLLADQWAPIVEMHNELKMLTLSQRRELHLSVDCYKHVSNKESSLHNLFKAKNTRNTRSGEQMVIPNLKTSFGRNAYSYRGPNHWHGIPSHIKGSKSVNVFQSEYLKLLLRDVNHPE